PNGPTRLQTPPPTAAPAGRITGNFDNTLQNPTPTPAGALTETLGLGTAHQLASGVAGLVEQRRTGAGHQVPGRLVGGTGVRPRRHGFLGLVHRFADLVEAGL